LAGGKPTEREAGGFGVYTQCVAGSLTGVVDGVGVAVGVTGGVVVGVDSGGLAAFDLFERVSASTPTTTIAAITTIAVLLPTIFAILRAFA